MIFAPLNVAAFKYTPRHLRGAAVGLFALLRNEGGSVGTSMAQTIQERREQFHLSRLDDCLDAVEPTGAVFLGERSERSSCSKRATRPGRSRRPCKCSPIFASSRPRRWPTSTSSGCAAVLGVVLVFLVLLMKRSVAEKGAPVGGE